MLARTRSRRLSNPDEGPTITFKAIVSDAEAYTCWRKIYSDRFEPVSVGRIEDQWNLSFAVEASYEELRNKLLVAARYARKVHSRPCAVERLIRLATERAHKSCWIEWDHRLGTIWIRAAGTCPRYPWELPEAISALCDAVKRLLDDRNLRTAVRSGEGELCGVPVDLFSAKFDEKVRRDDAACLLVNQ
jgi:hypothetical protein